MNSPYMGDFYCSQKYTHGVHDGLDLVGITHKEIHCVKSGTVVYAGWENINDKTQGFGQYVAIKENNTNNIWYYGHLSEIKVKYGIDRDMNISYFINDIEIYSDIEVFEIS